MFELTVALDTGARETFRVAPSPIPRKLADSLRAQGYPLNIRCGGVGVCDGCAVLLEEGALESADGRTVEAAPGAPPLRLLACVHRLPASGRAVVRIPARSLIAGGDHAVSDFSIERLDERLSKFGRDPGVGLAVDIGTTTVAAMLVDLLTGATLAKAARLNQQARHGDNVISRIQLCMETPSMASTLQHAITRLTLVPILRELMAKTGVSLGDIERGVVAGNTTMLHLLLGVDPSPMGVLPFTPAFLDGRDASWADLGVAEGPPGGALRLLPGMSAFVGADISAGVLATRLFERGGTGLLIDIGTNGEMVLFHKGRGYGCATAAGPCFEGVGMSCGSRAIDGAVSHILLDPRLKTCAAEVIGDAPPIGVCGSGYVDFLAEGRRCGLLEPSGRFSPEAREWPNFGRDGDGMGHFRLGDAPDAPRITELDVSKLLQAKAAIAAGAKTLLDRAGAEAGEVETLFLAGGFGLSVDVSNAIACGLLPGFSQRQVRPVGNTSLGGAYLALMDSELAREMDSYKSRVEILELNREPGFQNHYIDSMFLE